jgi:hypothetical protein
MPKLQSLFQHKSQHYFSICLSTVSTFVTVVFQHIFQHCFSICSSTVFQHMLQHCFSICSNTVSAYVPALCFSICSSTVFQHMLLCFSICYSTVFQQMVQPCFSLCSSICYSTDSAYVLALFQHMFQHYFSICSSTGFGLVPFFAICMLPFRLRLVKVDPPWLAGHLPTCVLVPTLRLYLPPHPLHYSAPSGRGTLDMSQTFEGGGVSWPKNY